jgi:vitamin B12 transporter
LFRYIYKYFFVGALLLPLHAIALPSVEVRPLKTHIGTTYDHKGGDLQQSLIQTPGVFIESTGAMGQMALPFVRGMNGHYAAVRVDGIPFDDQSSGVPDLSRIEGLGLDQATTFYGPEVLLYSGHGVGVLDLRTKNDPKKTTLDLKAGSFKTAQASVKSTVVKGRSHHTILASHRQTGGLPQYDHARIRGEQNRYTGEHVGLLSTVPLGDRTTLKTQVRRMQSLLKYDQSDPALSLKPQGMQETGDVLLGLSLHHETMGGGTQNLYLSNTGQRTRYDRGARTTGGATLLHYRQDIPWSSGHRTQLMVEGMGDALKQEGQFQTHRMTVAAAFLHTFYLGDHWQVDAGVRQEHTAKYSQHPLGALGVSWSQKNTKLYGSWRQGCRLPTLYDTYGKSPFFDPNPRLKPEQVDFWEVGWGQRVRHKGQIQVAYFQNQTNHKIITVPLDLSRSTVQNLSHTETAKGVEVSGCYPFSKSITLKGTYTYTSGSKNLPKHQGSLTFLTKGAAWQMDSTIFYGGSRQDWSQKQLPGYVVQNVMITYTLTDQWRVYGEIKNIWDERYDVISSYRSPRRAFYVGTCINL